MPLTWTDGNGVTVTKTFVFRRSMFAIGLEYSIDNKSSCAVDRRLVRAHLAQRSRRSSDRCSRSTSLSRTRGPAIYDRTARNTSKLDIDEAEHQNLKLDRHERLARRDAASLRRARSFRTRRSRTPTRCRRKAASTCSPPMGRRHHGCARRHVASSRKTCSSDRSCRSSSTRCTPNSSRVADYGMLTLLSKPLFWLLDYIHAVVKNWGVAIILATFLLKLAVLSTVGEGRPLDGEDARARAAHEGTAGNLQGRSLEARPGDDGAVPARRK